VTGAAVGAEPVVALPVGAALLPTEPAVQTPARPRPAKRSSPSQVEPLDRKTKNSRPSVGSNPRGTAASAINGLVGAIAQNSSNNQMTSMMQMMQQQNQQMMMMFMAMNGGGSNRGSSSSSSSSAMPMMPTTTVFDTYGSNAFNGSGLPADTGSGSFGGSSSSSTGNWTPSFQY
jgi:hypothetical protein